MGRPADISARLRFMFPGCLKQAGTLSNGHRTAKEEVPLTGERGGWGEWGVVCSLGPPSKSRARTEGDVSPCLYSNAVRLAGQEVWGNSADDAA